MKSWYTAKQVIIEALALVGDFEQKNYELGVIHFMRAYRDFNLFHNTSFTKVWLPVTGIKSVSLPDDFIELVWIGTHFHGEIWTFTKNSKMLSPSAPIGNTLITERHEDGNLTPSYNEGVNEKGYYSVNLKANRIELGKAFLGLYHQSERKEVYVGYIGNDITDINSSFVPLNAVNLITTGIAYQIALSANKPNPYVISQREKEYLRASGMYDSLSLPSADELLDAIYSTSGQGIR